MTQVQRRVVGEVVPVEAEAACIQACREPSALTINSILLLRYANFPLNDAPRIYYIDFMCRLLVFIRGESCPWLYTFRLLVSGCKRQSRLYVHRRHFDITRRCLSDDANRDSRRWK